MFSGHGRLFVTGPLVQLYQTSYKKYAVLYCGPSIFLIRLIRSLPAAACRACERAWPRWRHCQPLGGTGAAADNEHHAPHPVRPTDAPSWSTRPCTAAPLGARAGELHVEPQSAGGHAANQKPYPGSARGSGTCGGVKKEEQESRKHLWSRITRSAGVHAHALLELIDAST